MIFIFFKCIEVLCRLWGSYNNRGSTDHFQEFVTPLVDSNLTLNTLESLSTETPDSVRAEGAESFLQKIKILCYTSMSKGNIF